MLVIGETGDVYVIPGAGPYGDQVEKECREWRLVRNYWRAIGSPERDCGSNSAPWFPWKSAGFTPEDAGRAWKDFAPQGAVWTASFSPQGAAAAWTASGFNLDELIAAWKVAEFSPVIAIVRWLEQGYTGADICAAWASVGYTFVAVAPGRWGESSCSSTSAKASLEEQQSETES
jgi:hypothetical protein